MTRLKTIAHIAAIAALLCIPVLAGAAPAQKGTLSAGSPVFEWTGAKKTASTTVTYSHALAGPCNEGLNYCDDTLLKMDVPAGATGTSLIVEIPATGANDFDIYVYKSDESGSVAPNSGVGLSNAESPSAEKVTVTNPTGFYIVRVVYYEVTNASYPGKATLKGLAAPPSPSPNPNASPTPTPEPSATPTPPPPGATPTPGPTTPPKPPAGPPTPAPQPSAGTLSASLKVAKTRLAAARRKGLPLTVTCSRDCLGQVALGVDKRTARKLRLGRKATVVGRGKFTLAAKGSKKLRIRFTKRAAKALGRARSVKLSVVAQVSDPKRAQKVTVKRVARLKR